MNWLTIGFDRLTQAMIALGDNRLRTILSILGIAIGIAAVIAVGTVSKGGNHLVYSELETFGLKSIWIYRDFSDKDPHRRLRAGTGIDNNDINALNNCCPALDSFSPMVRIRNEPIVQTVNQYSNARVQGAGINVLKINNDVLTEGRPFRSKEISGKRPVAIIGPTVKTDLFGKLSPIGKEFRIGLRKFTVIGVLKHKSRDFLSSIGSAGGRDANNRIFIPYTTAQKINNNNHISYIHGQATELTLANQASEQVINLLERRHNHHFDYVKETMASYLSTTDRILGGVAVIGIVAASISLLVGGMGITNIMSTAVLERTREIGMRKALGARRRDILWQFLLEAIIISTIGGIAGLALGGGASLVLAWLTHLPVVPSPLTILIALFVSVLAGILSGFLPARRAARLHPVEALRYE